MNKIGDIVTISKGKKHNLLENPSHTSKRVLTIEDLRNNIKLKFTDDLKGTVATKNDVLIAWDGANAGTIGYGESGYIGSTIARLRIIDSEKYYGPFLGTFLRSKFRYLRKTSTGATIPHINRQALDNIKVPGIEIDDQIRIASVLSRVEGLIAKRKESIQLLDDFLKSTFMDMFGDPVRNEKEPKRKLGDYISFITSGSRGWAKYYSDEGDVFLRINNIRYGYFKLDDLKYVNAPNNAEAKRTKIETNDLLISITADLGRTAVVTEQLNGSFINQHLALIRLKKEDINPLYLAWYFAMPFGRSVVLRKNRNAVKAGLNFDDIKAFDIVVPPLDIQNQFVAVVTKVENIRSKYKDSLEELVNIYGSLSQRAFKGELDLKRITQEVKQ